MWFKASNRPSSSNKRARAPSASGAPPNPPRRLRAHDLEGGAVDPAVAELFKGPDSWVNVRKMLVSGTWYTRTQQAGVVQHDSQMGLEDISTCIHTAGMYAAHAAQRQQVLIISLCRTGLRGAVYSLHSVKLVL